LLMLSVAFQESSNGRNYKHTRIAMLRNRFQLPPRTREGKGVKFAVPLDIATTTRQAEAGNFWGIQRGGNLRVSAFS
jgi:hypothetical protein